MRAWKRKKKRGRDVEGRDVRCMLRREAGGYSRKGGKGGSVGLEFRRCCSQPAAGVDSLDRGEGRKSMPAMQEGEEGDVLARKRLADARRTCRPHRWLRRPGGRGLKVTDGRLQRGKGRTDVFSGLDESEKGDSREKAGTRRPRVVGWG